MCLICNVGSGHSVRGYARTAHHVFGFSHQRCYPIRCSQHNHDKVVLQISGHQFDGAAILSSFRKVVLVSETVERCAGQKLQK